MKKHSNVQDNNDVTKQSLFHSFHLSAQSFWKRFCQAIGCLHTFKVFIHFHSSERKNFRISVLLHVFFCNILSL